MKRSVSGPPKRTLRAGGPNRPGPPTDFIALGSKTKSDLQRPIPEPGVPSIKKISTFHGPSSSPHHARMSPTIPEPAVKYIDCLPSELVKKVTDAAGDQETVDGLICGAIRSLRSNRLKPDQVVSFALMYLSKKQPSIFRSETVVECIVGLLKKDVGLDYIKSKGNSISAVLACNLLMASFEESHNWPSLLVKVFIEDSLGDRIWVDHQHCSNFVKAVCTAFDTVLIPKEHRSDSGEDTDKKEHDDILEQDKDVPKRFVDSEYLVRLYAVDMVRERVSRRQGTISAQDPTGATSGRHLLKTLTSMCGMSEVRLLAAHKLEMWIQNPKLMKSTQDLLLSICVNCREHNQDDVDVIGQLTRMRLKTKALLNHYIHGLKSLIDGHKDNISTLFNYIVYNELSNARNPTNMTVIAALLQHKPREAAETLAAVCQDLLLQQEDYLRAVRALLREIVRITKHDFQYPSFALGIMKEPEKEKFSRLDQSHKERYVASTADLLCLLMLVSVSPAVKEAINFVTKNQLSGEPEHEDCYHKHKLDLSAMQRDAIWWLHATVIPQLLPKMTSHEFVQHVHKVLFLKPAETYYMKDNWPPEAERAMLVRHCADVPILEDTIMRLAVTGLSHEHPLTPADTLELIGQLVRRAGSLGRPNFNPIPIERRDVIDTLLSLSQYHHPENIKLPSDYVPPSLAISLLYWTVWQTLLIISSFNPSSLGLQAWNEYPTLRNFMEMAIINNFTFPLMTVVDDNERSQIVSKEMQMVDMEKNEIIEFESHLAAATTHLAVTEESSLLLAQLIAMDTRGPPRRPSDAVLNQTRTLCNQIQVGPSLCRSRNPDFLLDIINKNGEDQTMPWLSSLVSSAKGEMSMLPVQCLCEYLMANEENGSTNSSQENEIVCQLQNNLRSGQTEESAQVINYFLRRLYSPQYETRVRAKRAVSLVLADADNEMEVEEKVSEKNVQPSLMGYSWLLHGLVSLPNYEILRTKLLEAILEAIMRESDIVAITAYVTHLSKDVEKRCSNFKNLPEDTAQYISHVALTMSHLLIDRQALILDSFNITYDGGDGGMDEQGTVSCIFVESILKIFLFHLKIVKKNPKADDGHDSELTREEIPWRDTQEEIFLRWPKNGSTAQLHVRISQAMILLLTFGPPSQHAREGLAGDDDLYLKMLYTWFDEDGATLPKAYLMDTQEEALLLPDWLKIRLLHCEVIELTSRLAIAGTKDLDLDQLLRFIQSFGIPYITMDRLLSSLDEFCVTSPELVRSMTKENQEYLIKLVEGQWKRGCCNGTNFHALISIDRSPHRPSVIHTAPGVVSEIVDLTEDQSEDSDIIMVSSPDKPYFSSSEHTDGSAMQIDESATNILQDLFMSGPGVKKTMAENKIRFRNLMRSVVKQPIGDMSLVTTCLGEIHALVTAKKTGATFLNGLYANTHWSCTLLRGIDLRLKTYKEKLKNKFEKSTLAESAQMFQKVMTVISTKAPNGISAGNPLFSLAQSWSSSDPVSADKKTEELGQLDWTRLEEFLRKQLAFLERDEEIKTKVALVAQILLEEIGSRKAKASRGKPDMQNDKFYASIGTTGLLIDWLQLLDPELLAHRPKLQRKLLFESQRTLSSSMPIKMSAKMSNVKFPQSLTSHQTYLLSLLTEHSNWETVHKCLQWLLSDQTCDPILEKPAKGQPSVINVDARTAMDFLWVCMHTSKIWKGRENKSSSLQEPVFRLDANQFCRVICYMVAASSKQNSVISINTGWRETSYTDLFLVFYIKFGQKELKSENLAHTVSFIYGKATEQSSNVWWQLLAQLYVLEPFHDIWDRSSSHCGEGIVKNSTLAKIVTSSEVGAICQMDALVQKLLDRIGYVKETGRVDTRDSIAAVQSTLDSAYDASLLLKKLASSRPAIVLRQLSLMPVTLSGRTWYEFREFKAKNHLLFMSQLIGILEAAGTQLFDLEYAKEVDQIFITYFQMLYNYCCKARRQMKEVMFSTLRLVLTFLQKAPFRASRIVSQYVYVLQGLMNNTYNDHDYIVSLISKILHELESASLAAAPTSADPDGSKDNFVSEPDISSEMKDQITPYLKMLSRNQDLENIAQVLADFGDTAKRKIHNFEPFLPHLARLFTTCRDSSIRHSALNVAITCARASPSKAFPQLLPAYMSCLTGNISSLEQVEGQDRDVKTSLSELMGTTSVEDDEIARTALDFLPDIVILCRERAPDILEAAFDCGSRNGVGVQPPGSLGLIGTQLAIGGNSTWNDLSELLSKSLTLLSGLTQYNVKHTPNAQS